MKKAFAFLIIIILILVFGYMTFHYPLENKYLNHPIENSDVIPATTTINTKPKIVPKTVPKVTMSTYPLHTNITATVFWVGEPKGNGSSEDNALSAYDDLWQKHYGGYDDYQNRNGYYPVGFIPQENPFYLDLPYSDASMKNRWVKIMKGVTTCYGQIEDAGPYVYKDTNYVFGKNDERPENTRANNAGMDVSPALRDCLHFIGENNADNKVNWQFIDFKDVPKGPWKEIVTSSGIYWE